MMAEVAIKVATLIAFIVVSTALSTVMLADLAKRRIPNSLWILFTLSGLLFHIFATMGEGLEFCLVGAFLGFGLLFMPFVAGGIAARDVKLTAGVGAWFGPSLTICVFICIAAVAALYHTLSYFRCKNLKSCLTESRVLYYRLSSLMHYLATDDGAASAPEHVELDEQLVSYTTAIFVSTLFLLGVMVVLWN